MVADTVGFQALGRHGTLGRVVDVKRSAGGEDATAIVVQGGVSHSLIYYVPAALVLGVSLEGRSVFLDVDLADFVPYLKDDGTIELRAPRR